MKRNFPKKLFTSCPLKLDLIRMTIPDKPRSRSQKYIKL
ncbi:MAG: Fic family protein [Ruminococcus sp.]